MILQFVFAIWLAPISLCFTQAFMLERLVSTLERGDKYDMDDILGKFAAADIGVSIERLNRISILASAGVYFDANYSLSFTVIPPKGDCG